MGESYGELYDLESDPLELENLWGEPEHSEFQGRMTVALLDRLIDSEAALHGESMRGPAYWKMMHRLPFDE